MTSQPGAADPATHDPMRQCEPLGDEHFLTPLTTGLEPASDDEEARLRSERRRVQQELEPTLREFRRCRDRARVAARFHVVGGCG